MMRRATAFDPAMHTPATARSPSAASNVPATAAAATARPDSDDGKLWWLLGNRAFRTGFGLTLVVAAAVALFAQTSLALHTGAVLLAAWPVAAVVGLLLQLLVRVARVDLSGMRRSLVLPAVGVSLLAPLSMHAVLAVWPVSGWRDFEGWVTVSLLMTGHIHILLAVLAVLALQRVWRGHKGMSSARVVAWCVGATAPLVLVGALVGGPSQGLELGLLGASAVAVQIAILGPVFIVPMMRLLRRAAERERLLALGLAGAAV
jgi:hypothetical protein